MLTNPDHVHKGLALVLASATPPPEGAALPEVEEHLGKGEVADRLVSAIYHDRISRPPYSDWLRVPDGQSPAQQAHAVRMANRLLTRIENLPAPVLSDTRAQAEAARVAAREEGVRKVGEATQAVRAAELPPVVTLRESLDNPDTARMARFDGLWDTGDRVAFVGAKKCGKTTTVGSLVHAALTGTSALGAEALPYGAGEPARAVFVLNYEMSRDLWDEWAADMGLGEPGIGERLSVWHLRGKPNPLAFEGGRKRLREALDATGAAVVVIDTYARAFIGCGDSENDNSQGAAWAQMVDELVGPERDLVLTVHTGVADDGRARGGTWLESWADNILIQQREGDTRYLSGAGRARGADRVTLEERLAGGVALDFDRDTLRVTLSTAGGLLSAKRGAGARAAASREAKADADRTKTDCNLRVLLAAVRDLDEGAGVSGRTIEGAMDMSKAVPRSEGSWQGGVARNVASLLRGTVSRGFLETRSGPRGSVLHSLTPEGERYLAGDAGSGRADLALLAEFVLP